MRTISTTYELVSPGECEEHGTIHEGESMEPDKYDALDGVNAVHKAAAMLRSAGATSPSSSHFHRGVWYSWRTSWVETRSFHLHGFTEAEEAEIYSLVVTM